MIITSNDLKVMISENKLKFTPPQQKIVDKLLKGDRLTRINSHRLSGGEFMWKNVDCSYLEHAGKVYKAFFNIERSIEKQCGIEISVGKSFIIKS